MVTDARIQSVTVQGPAGQLQGLLNAGQPDATHAALVCHPHPLYGGTMHNKVVFQAMKALNNRGLPVLRFNFRGAGESQGEHDEGRGEVDDVRAALDWLDNQFHVPMIFAGFSFGASTGMRAACPDPRVVALISIGTPIKVEGRVYHYRFLRECTKPKLFISGAEDEFGPREELERVVGAAPEPKRLVLVEHAGHFIHGQLAAVRQAIAEWVGAVVTRSP